MEPQENPYVAPQTVRPVVGIKSGRHEDLKRVASAQKAIIICVQLYLLAIAVWVFVGKYPMPLAVRVAVAVGMAALAIGSMVLVVILCMRVYGISVGIFLGILTMVPCLGLFILLMASTKATRVLRDNGYTVGFTGADLSQF